MLTADEMAVDGYYVIAGIARHEYKQGWKFLTLWDGYGLSEATWEPMSAFTQQDGSINPIFRSYFVENNEGQLLTRAETLSQRKKKNESPWVNLLNGFQPSQSSDLPGAVSTLVQIGPCRCARAVVTVAPALHRRTGTLAPRDNPSLAEGHRFCSDHRFRSTAPTLAVPCSPMPMVTSVSQMAA